MTILQRWSKYYPPVRSLIHCTVTILCGNVSLPAVLFSRLNYALWPYDEEIQPSIGVPLSHLFLFINIRYLIYQHSKNKIENNYLIKEAHTGRRARPLKGVATDTHCACSNYPKINHQYIIFSYNSTYSHWSIHSPNLITQQLIEKLLSNTQAYVDILPNLTRC